LCLEKGIGTLRWLAFVLLIFVLPVSVLAGATADQRAAILAPTNHFSQAEKWETLSGGSATNRRRFGHDAFSQHSANLPFEEQANFFVGDGVFRRVWVTAPASVKTADGLGPLYNARACQRCHLKDGRGHPPAGPDDTAVSMFLRLSIPQQTSGNEKLTVVPEPTYGGQLQDLALPGYRAEGRMVISYQDVRVVLDGGKAIVLRKPTYSVADLAYGPMHPDVMLSPRVAPPMIGLGLLEAIAEVDILAHTDPDDVDGDGISGRPNRVWSAEQGKFVLGRFGWKAGQPSLAEQGASAFAGDIGISNPLVQDPWGDCTEVQTDCRTGPHGDSPKHGGFEAPSEIMEFVLFYARNLAVPARRDVDATNVLAGKRLFYVAGCTGCHTPKFATRNDYAVPALGGQLIWPYSDLLLHDMGDGLADGRPEGEASGREWRTPPLWGIGLTEAVSGHTFFLHDGRARDLTEAILWHGGEGQVARDAFAAMPKRERDAVLAFLNSL
jgi:CxxC motif-containing protein (DUF1111 family)|tara:strand:- start:10 stop:1497 length:1488 start_codon:yes stop_codon:yes gene_type:complete